MKLAFVFCAAIGFFSFSGTTALHLAPDKHLQKEAVMVVPSWIALPDREFVTSIEYSGDPGSEYSRGAVTLDLPSDGEAEMAWLAAHFQAHGYRLEGRTSVLDQFAPLAGVITADDDASGRRLTFFKSASVASTTLHILFEDPAAVLLASAP